MRIKSVHITNFRSLHNVQFRLDDVTALIGPNGAGKSSALRALEWFFSSQKSLVSEADFSAGGSSDEIRVEVVFNELSEADRLVLGRYVPEEAHEFRAWKRFRRGEGDSLSANVRMYSEFAAIRVMPSPRDRSAAYKTLAERTPSLALPVATSGPAVEDAMRAWEATHPELLTDAPESLSTEFFGFTGTGRLSGLFKFVLVPAELKSSEEMRDGRDTAIGQLLGIVLNRGQIDLDDALAVEQFQHERADRMSEAFGDVLQELQAELEGHIAPVRGGRALRIQPTPPQLKLPSTLFELNVLDGEAVTTIEAQGHGFQRALLLSVIQLLSERQAAAGGQALCIAIEEPELFQHPGQAKLLARLLRRLTESQETDVQVVYATHSPYFVDPREFHKIRRFTRDRDGRADVVEASVEKVAARLPDLGEARLRSRMPGMVTNDLSSALFADAVLLVEGSTDRGVLMGVQERDESASSAKVATEIVVAGSKSNLLTLHAVLSSLGVACHVLADADARHRSENETTPSQKSRDTARQNRQLLTYFGLEPCDFPELTEVGQLTLLPEDLEAALRAEWPEWAYEVEVARVELEATNEKDEASYRLAASRAPGRPPRFLMHALQRVGQDLGAPPA